MCHGSELFHYLGEMMCKRPNTSVGIAAKQCSERPKFESWSGSTYSHPITFCDKSGLLPAKVNHMSLDSFLSLPYVHEFTYF
jgi:hypothetical protein